MAKSLLQIGEPHKNKRKAKCGVYAYHFCLSGCSYRRTGNCRFLCLPHWSTIDSYRGPENDGILLTYTHTFKK